MDEWMRQALDVEGLGLSALPAAFLFGLLGALSSCCTLPVIGAVAGYSGSLGEQRSRREVLLVGLFFMVGTVLSLAALGAATGLVGHMAGASLSRYWGFAAGLVVVLFGLVALDLVPFRIPKLKLDARRFGRGVGGAMVYGLAVGGATTVCSVGCNPLVSVALGAAVLKGAVLLGAAILAVFALGYSLPLTAGLIGLGLGLGALAAAARRMEFALRIGSGALLVGVGFYLLVTL